MGQHCASDNACWPDGIDPPAPGGALVVTETAEKRVALVWGRASDPYTPSERLVYRVIRTTQATAVASALATHDITAADIVLDWTPDVTTVECTDLALDTAYFFAVIVRNDAGYEAMYKPVSITLRDRTPPVWSNTLDFSDIRETSVTVRWQPAQDSITPQHEIRYRLVRAQQSSAIDTVAKARALGGEGVVLDWGTETQVTATGLLAKTTYSFALIGQDAAGNASLLGPVSIRTGTRTVSEISPSDAIREVGSTTHFSAHVDGDATSGLTWSATSGSMNPDTGVWLAPDTSQTATIRATSIDKPTESSTTSVIVVDAPAILAFVATPPQALFGFDVSVVAEFRGGRGRVTPGDFDVTSGQSILVRPASGATTYTLTVTGASGRQVTAQSVVAVSGVSISSISGPPKITAGEMAAFQAIVEGSVDTSVSWSATDGLMNETTGEWIAPDLPGPVTIIATSRADISKSTQLDVTVIKAPAITGFAISPSAIARGAPATLRAEFSGGVGSVDHGIGPVTSGIGRGIRPTESATYRLTVQNELGSLATATANVTVGDVYVSDLSPKDPTRTVNTTTLFTAKVVGTPDASLEWSASAGVMDAALGRWKAPSSPSFVTITATSKADRRASASTTVTVVAAPTILRFSASPKRMPRGGSSTLTALFSGGTGMVDHGVGPLSSGVGALVSPSIATQYVLTVTNAAGTSLSSTTAVSLMDVTISTPTSASGVFSVGGETTFTSTVAGAVDTAVVWSASGGTMDPETGHWTAPNTPGMVTITSTSHADPSKSSSTSVSVVELPTILGFVASPPTIAYDGTSVLFANFKGGVGVVEPDVGAIENGVAQAVSPRGATSYTLTVTNAAGTAVSSTTDVMVLGVTITGLAPTNPTRTVGTKTAFSALVTGSLDTAIQWSASDGTIDPATGLWTAPMTPGPVTITAAAHADPTRTAQTTVTVVAAPGIASFTASPATISLGDSSTLYADFSNGTAAIDHSVGAIVSGAPKSASPQWTTSYQLTVTNAAGTTATASTTITVIGVTMGPISPSAPTRTVGTQTTFSATVYGDPDTAILWSASAGTIDAATGVWTAPGVAGPVTITATSHADPFRTSHTIVTVVPTPSITSFTASPTTISFGESTTLSANFSGGTASIDHAIGAVTSGVNKTITPQVTTTYQLTVTNAAGTAATATATVNVLGVTISALAPLDPIRTVGTQTTFSATVGGAVDTSIDWSASAGTIHPSTGVWTAPDTPGTVTITAAAHVDPSINTQTTVTVVAVPSIASFTASPANIPYGGSSALTATFSGGTASVNHSIGAVASGVGKAVSPVVTTTYHVTVTNAAGASVTATADVTVSDVAITGLSPISPTRTVYSQTIFTATVTGAVDTSIDWSASAGSIDPDTGTWTAPAVPGAVTITAASHADPTKTVQTIVTVVAAPSISSFYASPLTIAYGDPTTLTANFSGGTGSVNYGVGSITSGVGKSVSPPTSRTYQLTVTNVAGTSVTATADVNVTGVTVSAITPSLATRTVDSQTTFSATVTGALDPSIDWTASGGVIDPSTGQWTAPSTPGNYTITAASHADPTRTAQTTVTVVAAPSITSFAAGQTSVPQGSSTNLTAVFLHGTGSVNQGVGSVSSGVAKSISPQSSTTYTLTVTNAAGTSVSATATVTVTVASLAITPSPSTDFGSVSLGQSADATLTVTNSGDGPAVLGGVSTAVMGLASPFSLVGGSCTTGLSLASSATCTLTIRFSPTALGGAADTVELSYTGGGAATSYALAGTGIPGAILAISPGPSHAYGVVVVSQTADQTFTVANSGGATATLGTVSTAGLGLATPFSLVGGTCTSSGTVAPSETCTLMVRVAPTALGTPSDSIDLSYSGGSASSVSASINATAVAGAYLSSGDGTGYDFGPTIVGTSQDHTLTFSNQGDTPAILGTVSAAGLGLAAPFSLVGGSCTTSSTVSAGNSCTLDIRFTPTAATSASDSVDLSYTGGTSSTISVGVTAHGTTAAVLSFGTPTTSGSPAFGSYKDFTVALSNSGSHPASQLSLGSFTSPWSLQSTTCGTSLAGSSSCSLVVRFTSPGRGSFSQGLSVSYHDGLTGQSASSTLSETGTVGAVNVTALYSGKPNWNDYVTYNGSDAYTASGAACAGTEGGTWQRSCIHSGEKRVIQTATSSCSGLTLTEALGAFDWICREVSGNATFYSVGLKETKGLADLVDASAWKSNYVTIHSGAYDILESAPTAWWTNTVTTLPDNSSGVSGTVQTLASAGTIYTFPASPARDTNGYNINANSIAIVTLPGATMKYGGSASNNYNGNTGETGSPTTRAIAGAGAQKYLWFEGAFDCVPASGTKPAHAIATYDVKHSVFRRISATGCASNNFQIAAYSAHNLFSQIATALSDVNGFAIVFGSYNTLTRIRAAHNVSAGIVLSGGLNNATNIPNFISDCVTHNNGTEGLYEHYAHQQIVTRLTSFSNGGKAVYIYRSSHGTTSHLTTANNGNAAWHSYCDHWCSNGHEVSQFSSVNDTWGLVVSSLYGSPGSSVYAIANLAISHSANWGVYFDTFTNTNGLITKNLLLGANASGDCYVSGGTNPGLVHNTCANQGTSNASYQSLGSSGLGSTFLAKVTTNDSANVSDVHVTSGLFGVQAYASIADWFHFDNLFRGWGKESANAFPNAAHRGRCTSGDCRVWDWRVSSADTVLLNRSSGNLSSPVVFNDGDACPSHAYDAINDYSQLAYYPGINAVEWSGGNSNGICESGETCVNHHLINATEILFDGIGDDDGLCEAGEACIFSPNIGAYQGSGDYKTKHCVYDNASAQLGVTDVTLYAFPGNGE